jgi:acetylornithine deacetylase/succinyl-diaminopimelate desuccinylase-like protein
VSLDTATVRHLCRTAWADSILPELRDYIAVPALSPAFDPDWASHGHIDAVVEQARAWCAGRAVDGLSVSVHELPGRTPVLVAEVAPSPGCEDLGTVVLYGHLDKQPEMVGWREGLGPWTPVVEGDRLYGRGGADDGYAVYASLAAVEALQRAGGRHGRLVVLIETSEESGSPDLPAHVDALAERLGPVELVVCLDSGCADYETLWLTTSLRGLVDGTLTVEVLTEGVHSGSASGVVPSTFRIARQLLDRVEDVATGRVRLSTAHVEIPEHRRAEAAAMVGLLGESALERFPFVPGAGPVTTDVAEGLLNRTWRPTLSVIGADGLPATTLAGNVLRPVTALKLSFRLPPTAVAAAVREQVREVLTDDPPYGARVTFERSEAADGWNAPALAPWLAEALEEASLAEFGRPVGFMGEGGSIPFMGMLGQRFPEAQFVITGVLGPGSNAHGPNEFLHLPTAERLTRSLTRILDAHAGRALSRAR